MRTYAASKLLLNSWSPLSTTLIGYLVLVLSLEITLLRAPQSRMVLIATMELQRIITPRPSTETIAVHETIGRINPMASDVTHQNVNFVNSWAILLNIVSESNLL